ncbi:YodC family protein [Moritella viscosa]|uniref:DUF2158 domain-containing protein n=1 Tax=Moritella viscosa TaxID=80854 RepID=A0A1L0AR53_9GAMM|nr:DUF2158 domain-containing protein [Moritella viscosa]SGZ17486.1 Putative uncharacterized protein [Moritella viscosa]
MSKEYAVGICVKLKSGGPEMTVKSFSKESGYVNSGHYCQWFAGKKLESGYFPYDSLEEVKAEK